MDPPPRYSTAVYLYTPPLPPSSASTSSNSHALTDAQTAQTALNAVLQSIRAHLDRAWAASAPGDQPASQSSRWFLQIRSLRLADASSPSSRTMWMFRNASSPEAVTVVIEDAARAAVNISSMNSQAFDALLSSSLLPPVGGMKDAQQQQQRTQPGVDVQDAGAKPATSSNNAVHQNGRWIPRPSYTQVEGVTIHDTYSDFVISVGMLSARGGASGSSANVSSKMVIRLEYAAADFFDRPAQYAMLVEYLTSVLPANSSIKDISAETTSLDWRSLLAIGWEKEKLPRWSERNFAWTLLRLCKMERMV